LKINIDRHRMSSALPTVVGNGRHWLRSTTPQTNATADVASSCLHGVHRTPDDFSTIENVALPETRRQYSRNRWHASRLFTSVVWHTIGIAHVFVYTEKSPRPYVYYTLFRHEDSHMTSNVWRKTVAAVLLTIQQCFTICDIDLEIKTWQMISSEPIGKNELVTETHMRRDPTQGYDASCRVGGGLTVEVSTVDTILIKRLHRVRFNPWLDGELKAILLGQKVKYLTAHCEPVGLGWMGLRYDLACRGNTSRVESSPVSISIRRRADSVQTDHNTVTVRRIDKSRGRNPVAASIRGDRGWVC